MGSSTPQNDRAVVSNRYRIRVETRGNGEVKYFPECQYPEFPWQSIWFHAEVMNGISYLTFCTRDLKTAEQAIEREKKIEESTRVISERIIYV